MSRVYLYTYFERFWHWAQALLIFLMLFTGFEVHGTYSLLGFEEAATLHNAAAAAWGGLYLFVVFWLATTGEWKQYKPRLHGVGRVAAHYAVGIFAGREHPAPKTPEEKHNPLQRLTYLFLLGLMAPFQIITGALYYFYKQWEVLGLDSVLSLKVVAVAHTMGAFGILCFAVVHMYMTTTGPTPAAYLLGMIKGYEENPDAVANDKPTAGAD